MAQAYTILNQPPDNFPITPDFDLPIAADVPLRARLGALKMGPHLLFTI